MYKIRTRKKIKIYIIIGALAALLGSMFFFKKEVSGQVNKLGELLEGLINSIESNEPVDKLFEGDALVQNVYRKALDSQKRRIAENIKGNITQFQTINGKVYIDQKDLSNILYNNTTLYRLMKFSCKNCYVNEKEINKSYQRVLKTLKDAGILTDSNDNKLNRIKIDTWITSQYFLIADSNDYIQEISTANKGEDVYMNGIEEDADYDLQIDIENIGKLMFESFIAPTEIVFYNMPKIKAGTANNSKRQISQELNETIRGILDSVNTGSKSLSMEEAKQEQINATEATGQTVPTTNTDKPIAPAPNTPPETTTEDPALQAFRATTNNQSTNNQLQAIQGNTCSPSINGGSQQNDTTTTTTSQTTQEMQNYIQAVEDQIASYENINSENQLINSISNPALENMTPEEKQVFIEKYTNKLLDDENTESCLQKCSSLPLADRVVCQIKCLCFTMTRPKGLDSRFDSMNDMLKLRFCMVPTKSLAIPKGKNIYSLEDIYTRIHNNMYNLINNGEMVKYQRNKEFLESPISEFKFTKMISFQINLNSKPIFGNKSDLAKRDEVKNDIRKLEQAVGKESPTREKGTKPTESITLGNDINKYLIIQDTAKNKVYKEYAESAQAYEIKYQQAKANDVSKEREAKVSNSTSLPVITENKTDALGYIAGFLENNFVFWQTTELELQNINNIILSLKSSLK